MTLRQLLTLTLAPCVLGLVPGASAQIRSRRMPGWPQVPVHSPLTPRDASPAVSAPRFHQIAGNIYEYDWILPTGAGPVSQHWRPSRGSGSEGEADCQPQCCIAGAW